MGAKVISSDFPLIVLRKFTSIEDAYNRVRDLGRNIDTMRRQLVLALNDHASYVTPTEGAGAPSSTPSDTGLLYLDTSAKDMYMSVGTASSADWKKITP